MKRFIARAVIALFALGGVLFTTQTCSADYPGYAAYGVQQAYYGDCPEYESYGIQQVYYGNYPEYGSYGIQQAYYGEVMSQRHVVDPRYQDSHPTRMQKRTGYTRNEIRSMPMVDRPNRAGHFIGNTVRRRAGTGY